ncbi:OB-fold protein [Caviibacter abscessus]|uniref:OB-fold protein n=1 Tax=Caviibacter abscessus TaxID=1766719 RepID=UPI000834CA22|nr:hypothetical protein [Caviibacter abscessus]
MFRIKTIMSYFSIFLFSFLFISCEHEADDKKESTQNYITERRKEKIYYSYSVSELIKDLKKNALKASKKYKNKDLEITGVITVIDSDGQYISLSPNNNIYNLNFVQCYLSDETQRNKIANMEIGEKITLQGTVKDVGEVLGYSFIIDNIIER